MTARLGGGPDGGAVGCEGVAPPTPVDPAGLDAQGRDTVTEGQRDARDDPARVSA